MSTSTIEISRCISPWHLFDNDGSNPCQKLVAVMDPCATQDNISFVLPSLNVTSQESYPAPVPGTTNLGKCQCTEAGYNLYSACTACQVGDHDTRWLSRADWFQGCTSIRSSSQVQSLPPSATGVVFQEWITHIYDPKFSLGAALAVASGTPVHSATSTSQSNPSSTSSSHTAKKIASR
ncbi:hypothetical protein M408DRAFT_30253 [Serendipita vermifera MAFF 305830]|uniref:Uncharacterized protein n=1 Tax=Serendipita vermifera MAFF 305830 TaxID=933852 RepID=A0A0C2WSN8_SERVB|nr:hypothetical protein M408DRAFT_30253 [Serendipita vermifera MAFF 305830]